MLPSYVAEGIEDRRIADAVVWDGGPLPVDRAAEVAFLIPPYTAAAEDLRGLGELPALQVVQTLTAGVDHVSGLVPAGVTLCNAAGVHDTSTAELAVGLTIARLRHLDEFARAMPSGTWQYGRHESLADKSVLLVGFGGIGRAIAARLHPFECRISAIARTPRQTDGVTVHGPDDLDALLPTADVVILAVPLTDRTRGLVDDHFLSRMSPGALLVNVSRGAVVDTDALLAHCGSGRIQAALDVTDPEPLPPDHPLWRVPGVLISPHVGGNTSAFLPRARALVAAQLERWAVGAALVNVVPGVGAAPAG